MIKKKNTKVKKCPYGKRMGKDFQLYDCCDNCELFDYCEKYLCFLVETNTL